MPFGLHFGSDLGTILNFVWRPNRPKFGLRCPSKHYLFDVHGTSVTTNDCLWLLVPRSTPKRPKTDPRRLQEGLESLLVWCWILCSMLVQLGLHLVTLLTIKIDPKSIPKSIKKWLGAIYPHRILPRGPKTAPRCPKTSLLLGPPQEAFKTVLEPSWACLWSFWGRSWGQKSSTFIGFYTCFVTNLNLDLFWKLNRPKFGLRYPSNRYLLQKRDVHETSIKTNEF